MNLNDVFEKATEESPGEDEKTSVEQPQPESQSLSLEENVKLGLQGLLFNFSDEGLAALQAMTSDLSYDDAVAAERKILEEARQKDPTGALVAELGGALVPSLVSMAFTGGASTPLVLANLAKIGVSGGKTIGGRLVRGAAIGGAEGLTAGVGAAEGDIGDRLTDTGTLISAGAGAAARPLMTAGGAAGKKFVGAVSDFAVGMPFRKLVNKLGKAETAELNRVIDESGLSADEIIRRSAAGETIAEMSESVRNSLKAIYNASGRGQEEVSTTLRRRATEQPQEAMSTLQEGLTPKPVVTAGDNPGTLVDRFDLTSLSSGNILKYFGKGIKDLKTDEGKAYDEIFARGVGPSEELNEAVLDIITSQKRLRSKINALMEASGKPKLFDINKDTNLPELTGDVDLETAEILRRALNDRATSAFQSGEGAMGQAVSNLERDIRKVLDDISPDLQKTRAQWAAISSSAEAFDEGSKILTRSADQVEVDFEKILGKGDDAVAAFRMGYASALRNKKSASNVTTLFRNLNDAGRKEQQILNTIYPGDSLDEAVKKINLADAAMQTRNVVLGGSPTQKTQAAARRIGSLNTVANLVEMVTSPLRAPLAAFRIIRDFAGRKAENLSPEQLTNVAKMLTEEDPDVLSRVLRNKDAFSQLSSKYNEIVDGLVSGAVQASTTVTAGDIQREESPRVVKSLVGGLSPSAQKKIIGAVTPAPSQ